MYPPIQVLELELTGRCQLQCVHCYAQSSPTGGHGVMTEVDWISLVDQAAALGIPKVQLIGGEPTMSPAFEPVLRHAVALGREVQVYTNLFHVRDALWELFSLPGVTLATSYYSDQATQHDAVTTRTGSHERTTANILEAPARGVLVRVGLVELSPDRPATEARLRLKTLGVTDILCSSARIALIGGGGVGVFMM